ncbi:MAG: DUF3240 family protein [Betaproteobacteria bacterium]|nr:DUF3240 family protein [Betaproteobacteria bacterium]
MTDVSVLLTVIVPDAIAEAVADVLLGRPDLTSGFSMSDVRGHGSSIRLVEPGELVAGYAQRKRLDSLCENDAAARRILAALKAEFAGVNLYYWLAPVIEYGRLV